MPDVVVTYLLDCAHAFDPHFLMSVLQSTFLSYGSPDEHFVRRLRDELHRNGVRTFFFRKMLYQASDFTMLCMKA